MKSCGALGSMGSTPGMEKREPWTPSVQSRCFSSSGDALVGEGALGAFCPCRRGSGWREWGAGVASGSILRLSGAQVRPAVGR